MRSLHLGQVPMSFSSNGIGLPDVISQALYTSGRSRDPALHLLSHRGQGEPGRDRVRRRRGRGVPRPLPEGADPSPDHPATPHRVHRAPRAGRRSADRAVHPRGAPPRRARRLRGARVPPPLQYRARGRAGRLPRPFSLPRPPPATRAPPPPTHHSPPAPPPRRPHPHPRPTPPHTHTT